MSKSLKGGIPSIWSWVPHCTSRLLWEWTSGEKSFSAVLISLPAGQPSSARVPHCYWLSVNCAPVEWHRNTPYENKGQSSVIPKGVFCQSRKHFYWFQLQEITFTPAFPKSFDFKLFIDMVEQRNPNRFVPRLLIVRLDLHVW